LNTAPSPAFRRLKYLLLFATLLLVIGLTSPLMTLSKFVLLNQSFSVLSGTIDLFKGGHLFLFLIIAGFSIVLPAFKIVLLMRLLTPQGRDIQALKRVLHLLHDYGRWAMLDVMVVAVLVVTVKLGAIASIEIHYGLYVFGVATLLIMLITHFVSRLYKAEEYVDNQFN